MEKSCTISFGEKSFNITGIAESPLVISNEGDVDVTPLVECLIILLDKGNTIKLETQEDSSWDEKKKLIYKLIRDIIEKYNGCLSDTDDVDEIGHNSMTNNSTIRNSTFVDGGDDDILF